MPWRRKTEWRYLLLLWRFGQFSGYDSPDCQDSETFRVLRGVAVSLMPWPPTWRAESGDRVTHMGVIFYSRRRSRSYQLEGSLERFHVRSGLCGDSPQPSTSTKSDTPAPHMQYSTALPNNERYLSYHAHSAWLHASAVIQIRSALFWDVTQCGVILYRRFRTTYRSHHQVSGSPRTIFGIPDTWRWDP
jgi:hypothetical protein